LTGHPSIGTSSNISHEDQITGEMKSTVFATVLAAVTSCKGDQTWNQSRTGNEQSSYSISSANEAKNVNPDTHLVFTFSSPPKIGTSGFIKVYNSGSKKLVDIIDMSIPPSPNPSGRDLSSNGTTGSHKANPNDKSVYQTNIIGGFEYNYFPIIVHGNVASVYLHNTC
jgi:pectinesterase